MPKFNEKPVKIEERNTNNAWGFGGAIIKEKTYKNGFKHVSKKICYRHLPSHYVHLYYDNKGTEISKKQFMESFPERKEIVQENLF